jgi:hypothetical protein
MTIIPPFSQSLLEYYETPDHHTVRVVQYAPAAAADRRPKRQLGHEVRPVSGVTESILRRWMEHGLD